MTYSKLKPNNDQKKFISKQDTLMSRLYQAVPRARRETLAMHLGNKVRYGDLPDDYKEFLRTYKLEEAYQKCTGDLNKRSHSTNEMAAVEFLKICLIEKNVDVTWPLDKDADIYELEKLVRVSGHTELKHWLDQIEQWLAQEPLSNLTCVVRSYHRESSQISELIARGRKLIETGNFLEYYKIDFSSVPGDFKALAWSAVCLLARIRPNSLIKIVPRLVDPCALVQLHGVAYLSVVKQDTIMELFKSKNKIAAFFALDLANSLLDRIGHAYDRADLRGIAAAEKIKKRRRASLKSAYTKLWNGFFATGAIVDGAELIRLNEAFLFDRLAITGTADSFLEVKSNSFVEASFGWLSAEPSRFENLTKSLVDSNTDFSLSLSLAGEGLRQKVISAGASIWIESIQKVTNIFETQMKKKNERYQHQLSDAFKVRNINAWVGFWAGVEVFQGQGAIEKIMLPLIVELNHQLKNLWKPSAIEHGVEDSICYLAVVLLNAIDHTGSMSVNLVQKTLQAMDSVTLNRHSNVGNWDALLRFLSKFPTLPEVQDLIQRVLLVEGIDPKFLRTINQDLLQHNPSWPLRIKDLENRYATYFNW